MPRYNGSGSQIRQIAFPQQWIDELNKLGVGPGCGPGKFPAFVRSAVQKEKLRLQHLRDMETAKHPRATRRANKK